MKKCDFNLQRIQFIFCHGFQEIVTTFIVCSGCSELNKLNHHRILLLEERWKINHYLSCNFVRRCSAANVVALAKIHLQKVWLRQKIRKPNLFEILGKASVMNKPETAQVSALLEVMYFKYAKGHFSWNFINFTVPKDATMDILVGAFL